MWDLFREAIAGYNLPLTMLFALVLVYWGLVILGGLDLDFGGDFGLDGTDLDLGADLDVGADLDADVDLTGDVDHHLAPIGGGSALAAFLTFLNAHQVPLMIVLSFLFIFMWFFGIVGNFYFNPGTVGDRNSLIALAMLVPNFIVSTILTKIVTTPIKGLMSQINAKEEAQEPVVGREGVVTSSEVTREFGRVEIEASGAPIVINARIGEGSERLKKGQPVLIVDAIPSSEAYLVRSLKTTEPTT